MRVLLLFSLVFVGFLSLPSAADEVTDLRQQLEQELEEKKWADASKTAKKLKAAVKGDERKDVEEILDRIKGERAWTKLVGSKSNRKNPRKMLVSVGKFAQKYMEHEVFGPRIAVERQKAREKIYLIVEDFEKPSELDAQLQIVTGAEKTKQGQRAARWRDTSTEENYVEFPAGNKNWTHYSHLVFWIYSSKKLGRMTIDVHSDADNYFECWNNIDFVGWKEIRLPLDGKKSRFRRDGKPEWSNIDAFYIWKDESKGGIDIIIDDIRLERK